MKLHFYRGNFTDFENGYEQRHKKMNEKYDEFVRQLKVVTQSGQAIRLSSRSFSYPNREDFKLYDVDVGIDMGTLVAIVGPDGAGISTLLNLLAGDLVPTEANKKLSVRAKLGKFGLPSHKHLTPIAKLSGGQKARVDLTSMSMSKSHILLLDEPTNHLDMQSIDALADVVDEFTGGVVLVSHDSRLISRVCEDEERSQIWVVENGTMRTFPGSFVEYKEELLREIRAEVDD
ncbi:hypothetical protein Ancab_006844 [Ancistrocladus abbreviatus]